ncbi:alpha/beta hydrolase fold-3 domain-containing protein [Xylaria bambusicola]|uniref:alpha/beta hydrolase fold-3 domain-containing protein n=1 Tax=Xylaria bambusicola TaxID=326684 RepID=UPI002007712E|nr:alpha/beta hydrolase fold-3 domain-containing protein [Xylaria bambusicola]KAI0517159.1 alpha/beta hydrolase fold-3 domain-containing protein [Xylaria bambusicola]
MPTVTFPGRPLASYPVLSAFYKLFYSCTIIARLPVWIFSYALFPRTRPHSRWSFKQSIMLRFLTESVYMISRTQTPTPLSLEPGKDKERWEKLDPFPKDVYRGPLDSASVEPSTIGGKWYPAKPTDFGAIGTVLLHIHGGGFVVGTGRTDQDGIMAELFIKHGKVGYIFAPQYRLSCRPESAPFPAALQDSLTSYLYFVRTLGIPASNITISGDSAGGNLVIGLLRYLAEYGAELNIPQPKSAVILCPWAAPAKSLWPEFVVTSNPNFRTDYLGIELCRWGAATYIRDVPPEHPYITPLGHPFKTSVPMLVTFGSAEILVIDGLEWVKEMERVEGNEIETYIEPDAPHDTLLVGHILGFEESSAEVARKMGEFIRQYA